MKLIICTHYVTLGVRMKMEEAPSLSRKFTKSEPTQQKNHHSSSPRVSACTNPKQYQPNPPSVGQVSFRLLCHVHTVGGVIGNSGSIIKHLENLTGSKIRFEEGLPNCHERVINVVGEAAIEKKISLGDEEEEMVYVSKAQEGLIRVFERVLEVERNDADNEIEDGNDHHIIGFIGCRLLASIVQVGAVMGKGGKIVDGIRKSSGAKIRVFMKEQVPACAGPEEELIQITGGIMAVKKALCAVSRRLQDRSLEGASGRISSPVASHKSYADFIPHNSPTFSGSPVQHHVGSHFLSADVERRLNLDENSSQRNVVFKFLCTNGIAGGVIGKGANIVKFLEKETGATIKFTSPVSRSNERVAIISSLENPDPLYSAAQIAVVRVFARCIEVGVDQGVISSLGNGERVTARMLIAESQVHCLLDECGKVASDISGASSVEIKLMGPEFPNYDWDNDNVVQITGEYENVKSALFQLTGRLRESFFSGIGPKAEYMHHSYAAIPSSSPNGTETASSTQLAQLSILSSIDQLDHLGFVPKSTSPHSPGLPWKEGNSGRSSRRPLDGGQGWVAFPWGLKDESKLVNDVRKPMVEVMVPREVFGSVYGERGSNLARLKEISGATIILQDPCPEESCGKVIISGVPERIQIAQSLVHAFISF